MNRPTPKLLLWFLIFVTSFSFVSAKSALWQDFEKTDVAWESWSEETRNAAEESDKPLFFFVSYFGNGLTRAMLNETFANQTIAKTINDTSVPVLIDANEAPELASMLQRLAAEHFSANDFPICIWTDGQLAPLAGGGYFPPTDDWGGQGYLSLARNVSEQWSQRRDEFLDAANARLAESLETVALESVTLDDFDSLVEIGHFENSEAPSLNALDFYNFSRTLSTLAGAQQKTVISAMEKKLNLIYSGAGYDSVEGGFFIGSNDPSWRLPLFQKSTTAQALMLYSLASLYAIDPKPEYKQLASGTTDFIRNNLTKDNGLAVRMLDSYSKGETPEVVEGSFYLIDSESVEELSPETIENWGLDASGNLDSDTDILGLYTNQNIPYQKSLVTLSAELDPYRKELVEIRDQKKPLLSESTGYTYANALIVSALVKAGEVFGGDYIELAKSRYSALLRSNSDTVFGPLFNSDQKERTANSLDYAYLIAAALDLHSATSEKTYLDDAKQLLETWKSDERFVTENPIQLAGETENRVANFQDTFVPSAASVHLSNLIKLEETGIEGILDLAAAVKGNVPGQAQRMPTSYLSLLIAYNSSI